MARYQGRYANLYADIYSLFNSVDWVAENIKVYPKGYISNEANAEYAIFDVSSAIEGFSDSLRGILFIDIYVPNGLGPTRAAKIADIFDKYLAGATFATNAQKAITQFRRESTFIIRGPAIDNSSKLRSTYQIQFNYFKKET